MVCSFCMVKPAEGYLKWYCVDCAKLKRLIALQGDRVYEILDNVLLRCESKQKGRELIEIKREVENQEKKLNNHLNESYQLYENNENKEMLAKVTV